MFNLTKKEKLLLAFVIAGLLVGSAVRYYRQMHPKLALTIPEKAK